MKSLFNNVQLQFLKDNYSSRGAKFCSNELGFSVKRIRAKVNKLGLSLSKSFKSEIQRAIAKSRPPKTASEYSVNPEQFFSIQTPEVAYMLGLIWADGTVYQKGYYNKVTLECQREDFDIFIETLFKLGKWAVSYRDRPNRKEQGAASISNKLLVKFLIDNDYKAKSAASADKILAKIPEHLQRYWFLGLIDGDGCFYINEKNSNYQLCIASSYEQDWTYLVNLFAELGIKSSISRRVQGKNKSSVIRVTNKRDIIKFGNYIYQTFDTDKIGLPRKHKKFLIINDALLRQSTFRS